MTKSISLIPYNCGIGAQNTGCADGPAHLKEWGLAEKLKEQNIDSNWQEFKHVEEKGDTLGEIVEYSNILSDQVKEAVEKGQIPVTIGGDHSMAVGTWSGVAKAHNIFESLGLIWVDAHLDAHTPETSPSSAYHGMPAACLLGHGDEDLVNLEGISPKIRPEDLCFIGVRSFEKDEYKLLENLGVKIYNMERLEERGLEEVVERAHVIVTENTKGFGLTIDLDAFDPDRAPGVGSPEEEGLFRKEAFRALKGLGHHPKLMGIEIAEYNPHLDENHKTAQLVLDLLLALFAK